jgi:phosphoribosylformimino-5-aminoimidazole carboxamide ribotide isomerase
MQAETVYSDDPVAMGRRWVDEGARYLHVVDLDGAVSGAPVNGDAIAALCAKLSIPVEVGGGVRTVERAGAILALGADRVIFGTAHLDNRQWSPMPAGASPAALPSGSMRATARLR